MIRKQSYDNNTLQTTTDYVDGFVYVNNTLSYFPMPEGRVLYNSGTPVQEFIMTDQQGNARISFQNNGSGTAVVKQENSYYAFGLIMPNSPVASPGTPNKQLYNGGSEWQNDFSNLPDYQQTFYRNYDAAIGRWVAVDPVAESAERMSTYQYAGNNPVMMNDPMGDLTDAQWLFVLVSYYNGPIRSNYHLSEGGGPAESLDDANAFQAGAAYADRYNMWGTGGGGTSGGNGIAQSYQAAVGRYNASRGPGESAITTTSPVHVITATNWGYKSSDNTSSSTDVIFLDHTYDITGKRSASQGRPNEKIYGYYDNTRVGNAYVGGVTGLGFTVSYKLDGEPVKFDVLFDKASFTIHDYKVFGQGVNPATASTAFVLAYNLAISETAKEIEYLGNEGLPINQSSVRAAFLIDINLNLNAFRLGSIFNGGELPFNGSRNIPITEAKYLP